MIRNSEISERFVIKDTPVFPCENYCSSCVKISLFRLHQRAADVCMTKYATWSLYICGVSETLLSQCKRSKK